MTTTPAKPLDATLEVVKPANSFTTAIGPDDPVATSVEFGLWDNAYDSSANVIVDPSPSNDFVSRDSRRFYFRVRDKSAAGKQRVQMEWRTLFKGGSRQDSPATATLTMGEIAPGIFTSTAVMLVTETVDAAQSTNSQFKALGKFPANTEPRNRGQSDHRLRLGSMFGSVEAAYPAKASNQVKATVPIFPTNRRIITCQVFIVQNAFPPADLPGIQTRIGDVLLRKVTACYERIGMWFFAAVAPGQSSASLGTDIKYDVVTITASTSGANAVSDPTNLNQNDMTTIANQFPAIGLNTRIFFVKKLASNHGGDTFAPKNQSATGTNYTSWITVGNADYSTAHELGHSLTENAPPGGHYKTPTLPAGNHLIVDRNLMAASHPATGENTRLWDALDGNTPAFNQYTEMRSSRLSGAMP